MLKLLDKLVEALVAILSGREKVNKHMAYFLNKGNNGILIISVLFLIPFLIVSIYLHSLLEDWFWAFIPILMYVSSILFFALKMQMENRFDLQKKALRTN